MADANMDDDLDDLIQPPPEIRIIADKTAHFVATHGPEFEVKIRNTNADNQRFRFIHEGDVFHAYYRFKVKEYAEAPAAPAPAPASAPASSTPSDATKEPSSSQPVQEEGGAADAAADGDSKAEEAEPEVTTKAAVEDPIARAAKKVNKEEEPPKPEFLTLHPTHLPTIDLEIIRLVAQFTAVEGHTFVIGLNSRESKNPQFDFLKPTHPQFQYFLSLVDAYKKVIRPPPTLKARLKAIAASQSSTVLEGAVHRAEWNRLQEEKKRLEQADDDADRVAYLQIDWHDFVVVETITFDDEGGSGAGAGAGAGAPSAGATGNDGGDDDDDSGSDMDMDMDMDGEDEVEGDDDEKVKVRTDYVPQVQQDAPKRLTHFVDPRTGEQVPIEQSAEHMRVNLLAPEWKDQKKRSLANKGESAFTEDVNIAENLKSFAKARPDVFGQKRPASSARDGEPPAKK